jgi:hypothetical protein
MPICDSVLIHIYQTDEGSDPTEIQWTAKQPCCWVYSASFWRCAPLLHWHVYQKGNQRLFEERYIALVLGNKVEDPPLSSYRVELAFFDNYVIPLARNLEESNVFGVSCDEYLAYALENRREWEFKDLQIMSEMVASPPKSFGNKSGKKPHIYTPSATTTRTCAVDINKRRRQTRRHHKGQ